LFEDSVYLLRVQNVDKPVLDVFHDQLPRYGDSAYKSECPACVQGILFIGRNHRTFILQRLDCCVVCGQRVRYLDLTINGEPVQDDSVQPS